jgi:septal ring-binding cell division protein DamX
MNFDQGNYDAAFVDIRVPAQNGDPQAQYALGYMYYYGKGTVQNTALGKYWIQKSANNGDPNAQQAYQMIAAQEGVSPTSPTVQAKQTPVAVPVVSDSANSGAYTEDEKAVLGMSASNYTFQLLNMPSNAQARSFVMNKKLGASAKVIRKKVGGKMVYTIIYGDYASQAAANAAKPRLPASLKGISPWARSIASVQRDIQAAVK